MEMQSMVYFSDLFFRKLKAKAVAATTSMMRYWTMVTVVPAQKELGSTSEKVRLHWSMLTAYFWKGKMAE